MLFHNYWRDTPFLIVLWAKPLCWGHEANMPGKPFWIRVLGFSFTFAKETNDKARIS